MSVLVAQAASRSPAATMAGYRLQDAMASTAARPTVWVLPSWRAGDGSQPIALAEALGWPFEVKRFRRHRLDVLLAPPFCASIAGLDRDGAVPLEAPWPDLVLSSGRENEPVARWIKRQSGGRTRIVHVGRPWGLISAYDLVVTSRQYRLPERDNVLQNTAPLHRLNRERMARDAAAWARRLDHLPRPLIAVLVGGSSGPYAFTRRSGERLALAASALAARLGGSLLVTTSARTPEAGAQALAEGLTCPHVIYNWQPGSQDNPYLAFLGLADEVIVTADSMSMMAEACASGKPVHLFDLGVGWTSMRAPLGLPGEAQRPAPPGLRTWLRDFSLRARLYRWLLRHGPIRVTRDIRLVHRQLVESGRASWLGERLPQQRAAPLDDLARAVTRVHALMARPRPSTAADPGWLATPELAGAA
ncbi:MAG: ELM1/GtrOC1 family putative glycosyltransferase [Geminicoccaceae bacterium]